MVSEKARSLRKRMTPQEVKLWVKLRRLRDLGFHFRRQSPISAYIVDFECRRQKLIVEVDGGQHGFDKIISADIKRERALETPAIESCVFGTTRSIANSRVS